MIPVKFHHFPGDIPKHEKIAMMEGRYKDPPELIALFGTGRINGVKAFRRRVRDKMRAVLKRRTQKEIKEQMDLHPK